LTKSWVDDLGGDAAFPIIAAGRVYVTAKTQASTRLIALEAVTGQLDWMIDLGGGRLAANIAYDNGRIFVDNGNGLVMAFDAQTGARDWITFGGGTVVTPRNGVLYSGVSALDEATGAFLWHAQPAGTNPPVLQGTNGPAVTSSGVYLSSGCPDVWDFDPATGREIWHLLGGCTTGFISTPAVYAGRVYARGGLTSVIVDAQTGHQVGSFQPGVAPAFDGNQGFFLEGPTPLTLRARTLDGVTANWAFTGDGQLVTSPISVNGVVYIGSQGGNLYGLNETTGAQLWTDDVGAPFTTHAGEDRLAVLDTMAAGLGMLLVPASHRLVAYTTAPPPGTVRPSASPAVRTIRPVPASLPPRVPSTGTRTAAGPSILPGDAATAYQIDAQHTGTQPSDPLSPPLRRRWSVDLGAGIVSYPVIADGKVFVTSVPCSPPASCNGSTLYALDQLTGQLVWGPIPLGGTLGTFSAATWDGGRLFVLNGDGLLRAFDDLTGTLIWSKSYGTNQGTYAGAPVARNGILYIKAALAGTGSLIAVREIDGSAAWGNADGYGDHGAPAVTGDAIYVVREDAQPTKIDLFGSTRWQHAGAPYGDHTPAVAGSAIYGRQPSYAGDNGFTWNTQNGEIAGAFTASVAPAIDGSLGSFTSVRILQEESLPDNHIQWEFAGDGGLSSAPLTAGGIVYQGSVSGAVYALDQATGHVLWSGDAGAPILAPDEHNPTQLTGMGIGQGLLVVPASTRVTAFETAGPQPVAALPALSNGAYGGYVTQAVIMNTGSAAASVSIKYFDQAGNPAGAGDVNVALPPNATWVVRQDNGHSFSAGQAGSGVIFSDQPVAAFVNEFAPGNKGDATSYTSVDVRHGVGTTLYAPAIANGAYGGYTTGIGLLNLGSSPAVVTITYRDAGGTPVKVAGVAGLAAHGYIGLYSGNPALGLPSGFAGTATITTDDGQPLAAIVNEVGPSGQFSSYDAVAGGAVRLEAPTALNNAYGGYYTGIGIQNTSAIDGTVTVTYSDPAGVATVKTMAIKANGYLGVYQGDAQVGPPASPNGYTAVIGSTVPVVAIVNEVAPPGMNQSTAYNTFAVGVATAHLALVENSGPDAWTTGLGVMNTSRSSETVTVAYYDGATGMQIGNPLQKVLAPNAFWGVYQPDTGLPAGIRATAIVSTSPPGTVAVICNEHDSLFMSYGAQ
jgi:outer membrane protein assembly factor BamB